MIRLYPIIIILQVFCIYHAYTNKAEQKWIWIILLLPLIGSGLYIYRHLYNRKNIDGLKEGIKESLIENYTINKLEKKVKFSDTYANKFELAQEHLKVGNNNRAIQLLDSCKESIYGNDAKLQMCLLQAHYSKNNFEEVVNIGNQLENNKGFKNTPECIAYALANFRIGDSEKAEEIFKKSDTNFSNYDHRLEYAKFLLDTQRRDLSNSKLQELHIEIDSMDPYERKINREVIRKIKALSRSIS